MSALDRIDWTKAKTTEEFVVLVRQALKEDHQQSAWFNFPRNDVMREGHHTITMTRHRIRPLTKAERRFLQRLENNPVPSDPPG